MRKILTLLFLFISIHSFSQSFCDSLASLKKKVFGFTPSTLSDSLKNLKSYDLNLFWDAAQAHPKEAAFCLQAMIREENADLYFCYDASMLLAKLDSTDKYYPTIISGLKKCELKDLQLEPYLTICFYLEARGMDIGALVVKLISMPNTTVYLNDRVKALSSIDASIILLNNMPAVSAENALTTAIMTGNSTTRHNAAILLTLQATNSGDSIINQFIAKKQLADSTVTSILKDREMLVIHMDGTESRADVLKSLNGMPSNMEKDFFGFYGHNNLIGSACKQLTIQDIDKIRKARAKSTPVFSEEALHEYYTLTAILTTVRDKKE